jgi:hypothetical protein
MVRGKAMGGKAGDLVDIMRDVLTDARLDDKARRPTPLFSGLAARLRLARLVGAAVRSDASACTDFGPAAKH